MNYKLGSLFDGSGGFPLAGALCGIEPCWASEVEPYPIAVTRERFPNMKHLGDISKINGAEIEPVDIITFGSPCQDLSVAGKRAGLKHEANGDEETTRSGLFMEAVRIIKEMRESTNGKYPRFALWENVPGAFSSNKGEDFRVVCEELIKVVEPSAFMPEVPRNGWPYADSYVGDGWSLAYRVFDAQYWGVPQRRRRIHLVVDFRGECAREVLFEREGVRGYFTQSRTQRETAPADIEGSTGADDREGEGTAVGVDVYNLAETGVAVPYTLKIRSGCEGGGKGALIQKDKSATLATNNDQYLFQPVPDVLLDDQGGQQINVRMDGKAPTLRAETHGNLPCVLDVIPIHDQATIFSGKRGSRTDGKGNGLGVGNPGDSMNTLTSAARHAVCYSCDEKMGQTYAWEEQANTLAARDYKQPQAVCYRQGGFAEYIEGEVGTLRASGGDFGGGSENLITEHSIRYVVRRLTPTECARLQGFADWWSYIEPKDTLTDEEYRFWCDVFLTVEKLNGRARPDEKGWYEIWREVKPNKKNGEDFEPYWENIKKPYKHKSVKQMLTCYNKLYTDSAEYKMWGNGIALPPALYCMQGIVDAFAKAEKYELSADFVAQQNSENSEAIRKVVDFATEEEPEIICMATQQGGAEIRTDDKAPTLTAAAGMSGNNQPVVCYKVEETADCSEDEPTDLSEAPENIKEQILENDELLKDRETEETTAETTPAEGTEAPPEVEHEKLMSVPVDIEKELIKLKAERDLYKQLYNELLGKFTKGA